MKRCWFGFLLLVALFFAALISSRLMEDIHETAAEKIEQAARYAMGGNWAGAAFAVADAKQDWENWELLRCSLADHSPAEEIDALFSTLDIYGSSRERLAFAAVCKETAQKLKAMGEAHGLNIQNLL